MNEKTEAAPPKGLDEAAGAAGVSASERPEPLLWRPEKPEDVCGQDLRKADLSGCPWLLPEHLAGSDLTGNRALPEEIAKFPALDQVAAISGEARKIFIGLLAACVYSWLVIGTTKDVALILNTASSPLPIINTPIPIADFYWVGPTILAAVYCYLHFYLLRLWRTLATLPAIFPEGTALDDKTDPWLLTGLVRTYMPRIPARPLGYVENGISVLLAWLLVPFTLFFCWWRLLPAHHINRLIWLALLIAFTLFIGWRTFDLARTTLQRQVAPSDRARALLGGIWRDFRASNGEIAVFCLVSGIIGVSSMFACWQSPRDADTNSVVVFSPYAPFRSLRDVDPTPAKLLNFVGIRTYADLRDVNVAEPPDGWDGKDWSKVKRVDLRGRNLAFADATRAFLANADLRGVNLTGAVLAGAQIQGAVLYDADADRGARLEGANLSQAQLQGADLRGARLGGADLTGAELQGVDFRLAQLHGANLLRTKLRGANLEWAQLQDASLQQGQLQDANLRAAQLRGAILLGAQLQGTELSMAQLQGAELPLAQLQGANLSEAQLQGANLGETQLQGARLWRAQLQGARLWKAQLQGASLQEAQLQGADLSYAQLQGTDMRRAGLWRSSVYLAQWDLADLRGAKVNLVADSDIDALISEATQGILDERIQKAAAERLNRAFGTLRPARPSFPQQWRSQPDVMFLPGDPNPEPFDWGPSKWATEKAYDENLAKFIGELACQRNGPDAQTRGLARRALDFDNRDRLFAHQFAARLTRPDCPPAEGLPEDMRRRLEQLAQDEAATASKGFPPDAAE